MTDFSPREIVSELDRFIVGQKNAKRAVAIALRNRWRRLRLEGAMREERVLDALVGTSASASTRDVFRKKLRAGELDDKEIEIEITQASSGLPMFELPNMPGSGVGAISIGDIFGKALGGRAKPRRTTV